MVQLVSLGFFPWKSILRAGWSRRWFHSKPCRSALATRWRPYPHVKIYMGNEVYFSLHDAAVVNQVSLNPNDSLFQLLHSWRSVAGCKNTRDCRWESQPDSLMQPSEQQREEEFSLVHLESVTGQWHCQHCTSVFIVFLQYLWMSCPWVTCHSITQTCAAVHAGFWDAADGRGSKSVLRQINKKSLGWRVGTSQTPSAVCAAEWEWFSSAPGAAHGALCSSPSSEGTGMCSLPH